MPDYQVPSLESAISGPLNFDPICPDENIGTDRRIRKTRQRLQAALLLLMKEEPLSQITMREVCRRADVGRSTPYSHFRDVEDILDQLEATFFQALSQLLDAYPAHADMEEKAQWFVQLFILARRHGLYLDLLLAGIPRPLHPGVRCLHRPKPGSGPFLLAGHLHFRRPLRPGAAMGAIRLQGNPRTDGPAYRGAFANGGIGKPYPFPRRSPGTLGLLCVVYRVGLWYNYYR